MDKCLVVGGSSGIGLAIVQYIIPRCEKVYVADKKDCPLEDCKIEYISINLINNSITPILNLDIDTLIITAGFGRIAPFETLIDTEIIDLFKVNSIMPIRLIRAYYSKLLSKDNFNCVVLGSISGFVSSPLFSVYSASKSSLSRFVENINIELEMKGSGNRILDVSPGYIEGTSFLGGDTILSLLADLAKSIIENAEEKKTLYIPDYEQKYKRVLVEYHRDPYEFGFESYSYKANSDRINIKPQLTIGYLSGTFDLFHIGHLNILKRAKDYCDYLVVGVHKDGSHKNVDTFISLSERMEIVRSISFVDEVVESCREDSDAWNKIGFDILFVGSDYKGTDRFNRYEEYFKDKGVEIVYFPYTQGTSSTKLRSALSR